MYRRKILRALVLILVLSSSAAPAAAKVDVFKEFETKINTLEKSLAKEKDVNKRYDLFLATYAEILKLRKDNPRQAEDKELNMSFFMESLAPLPAKKDFQVKKCPEYEKEVKDNAKAYDETQKDAFSEKAFSITKLICKK